MSAYEPPLQDMRFTIFDVLGFEHPELDQETFDAILSEAGKLARDVLAPLNWTGDQEGCALKDGVVTTPKGFKDAYAQYRDSGWNAVPFDDDYGGQGLPYAAAFPVQEMWQGANLSFGLCPLLNQGAVEAILAHGNQEQKDTYLPKLISGEWTGTMNLTEPQAGSDLGLLKAKAERQDDGTYRIAGQKIWITYGEHDFAENIIHLVLARLPDAPDDVKGISLFIVPKYLEDGTRNDVTCVGLDHKLGIHASPTCVMQYGDKGGATGYLLGEEHSGLKYMFTMMNNARLSVGLQGVAVAERAYQVARAYAADRVQGKDPASGESVTIDHHPDVQRMLSTMRSLTEAGRALSYQAALYLDQAEDDSKARSIVDLLTPAVKSWCTDLAQEVTSLAIQIHGGAGFIEETGVAQYYRDARILPIYEGTNGIQAMDLIFRKTCRDDGATMTAYLDSIAEDADPAFLKDFRSVTAGIIETSKSKEGLAPVAAAAMPYLNAFAMLAAGALMARAGKKARQQNEPFHKAKLESAAFFTNHILPRGKASLDSVRAFLKSGT